MEPLNLKKTAVLLMVSTVFLTNPGASSHQTSESIAEGLRNIAGRYACIRYPNLDVQHRRKESQKAMLANLSRAHEIMREVRDPQEISLEGVVYYLADQFLRASNGLERKSQLLQALWDLQVEEQFSDEGDGLD